MTMKILKRLKKIFWSKEVPEEDLLHLSESNNENDGKGPKVKKRSASMTPEETGTGNGNLRKKFTSCWPSLA